MINSNKNTPLHEWLQDLLNMVYVILYTILGLSAIIFVVVIVCVIFGIRS
jgi:hypothetical protein